MLLSIASCLSDLNLKKDIHVFYFIILWLTFSYILVGHRPTPLSCGSGAMADGRFRISAESS